MLKIDVAAGVAVEIGATLEGRVTLNCNKWQNGFIAADGRIYGIPLKADTVLCVDVQSQRVYTVGSGLVGFEKWEGGVLAGDGAMYCVPLNAKQILKIGELPAVGNKAPRTATGAPRPAPRRSPSPAPAWPQPQPPTPPRAADPKGDGFAQLPSEQDPAPQLWSPRDRAGDAGAAGGTLSPEGAGHVVGAEGGGSEADALAPWLCRGAGLPAHVRGAIETEGYVVLKGVLSRDEAAAELERLWDFVTTVSPTVRRDDPATWYPPPTSGSATAPSPDPWPHSGWRSFTDMFQAHQAGWVFSELREKLADRVFGPLYGTRELHSSKEGFTFHRPTASEDGTPAAHPALGRKPFVCGAPSNTEGEHFDQGHAERGLQYIQSSTCLVDQGEGDACFLCWPGSHALHEQLTKDTWRGRSHWVPLTDGELEEMRAAGLSPRRVPVSAGDVILWRSDLAHSAAPPLGPTLGFRAVSYTCMLPAVLTPAHVVAKKAEAYRCGHTTDHSPAREYWHAAKPPPESKAPPAESNGIERRPWYKDGKPPKLTTRQAELYGLVPYGQTATPT